MLQFVLKFDIWGKESDEREKEKELTRKNKQLINNWGRKRGRGIDEEKKEEELIKEKRKRIKEGRKRNW